AITRDFVAQHYLIGGDWGEENRKHSHHYNVELLLEGSQLDQHGYMLDIVEIGSQLDAQLLYYKDRTLNDLPEFKGLNPSIERFASFLCKAMSEKIKATNVSAITVKIWENDIAWASYKQLKQK
ncbi:MAG: 6-pyruvoyl trahydropterin synthase family protein, partial [Candidatus Bathyarchaeia archaeon]